ncbi:MAG: hypothetical protein FJZ16_06830 [Candidatus Omnitrophica bacterium]|nr:hypothetical protein [Candidatus Omnitrophota bacterium]MBM4135739.1 hypothetical protein [Nitrospira sp.]
MQLIPTKQYHQPSTEYHKRPLLIDWIESPTEIWKSQRMSVFVFLPIDEFIRQSEGECSVFLRPVKDIELLERFYTFNNPIEVKRFLLTHDYLINPLFEARRQIKRVFGENIVEVCLKYDRDPEEDFERLFIIVKINLSPDRSLDLLDKFDEEWWLDVDDEIRKFLEVDIEPMFHS